MDMYRLTQKNIHESDIFMEANIQRQLNHPNIVKFIDIRKSQDQ